VLIRQQVFYGPRSLVFPEADNRKWTIMAVFEYVISYCSWMLELIFRLSMYFGKHSLPIDYDEE
jgi:hypothetical protein